MLETIKSLMDENLPLVSNLANAAAVLNSIKNINWCGFYLFDGKNELYLGPFQGEPACTRIPLSRGVCGKAARERKTVIVDNVLTFEGHIACSSLSRSEIVVPILKDGALVAVIDVDSPEFSRFSESDKTLLEGVAEILSPLF